MGVELHSNISILVSAVPFVIYKSGQQEVLLGSEFCGSSTPGGTLSASFAAAAKRLIYWPPLPFPGAPPAQVRRWTEYSVPSGQATLCFGVGGGMSERAISVQLRLFRCALQFPFGVPTGECPQSLRVWFSDRARPNRREKFCFLYSLYTFSSVSNIQALTHFTVCATWKMGMQIGLLPMVSTRKGCHMHWNDLGKSFFRQ